MKFKIHGGHSGQPEEPRYEFYLSNSFLYDQLHILAAEYSLPVEQLVEWALTRFVADVEFFRELRSRHAGQSPSNQSPSDSASK